MTTVAVRNLDLAFEAIRNAVEDEGIAGQLADAGREGVVVLYDPNDADLTRSNDAIVRGIEARGRTAVRLEVDHHFSLVHR